jgi:hypothetical protein
MTDEVVDAYAFGFAIVTTANIMQNSIILIKYYKKRKAYLPVIACCTP